LQAGTILEFQEVAIILDGNWITGRWVKAHPETLKLYQPAMMPTEFGQKPGYVTLSGGWYMCINNLSKKKAAALDFIKFALNKENVLKYVLTVNNLSVRKDVAADPEYPKYLRAPTDMLKYTHFRPANGQYPIVSSKMSIAVESVATQSATPDQSMNTLVSSTERILGKKAVAKE
jgi:multiple sugar transport system substrate-binding protein